FEFLGIVDTKCGPFATSVGQIFPQAENELQCSIRPDNLLRAFGGDGDEEASCISITHDSFSASVVCWGSASRGSRSGPQGAANGRAAAASIQLDGMLRGRRGGLGVGIQPP